jgi:DNA-binding transcriptional ArsR family regulator
MTTATPDAGGDADLAAIGTLLADPGRCRMLLAIADGRSLPASRLAAEAGVTAATASAHLRKLLDAGLLAVEPSGRHRYYRLAGPLVAQLLELLQGLAPRQEVRSLKQGTRARALRDARTCYDHLAGRLGVAVMTALIDTRCLVGGDGRYHPECADDPVGSGHDVAYQLTPEGRQLARGFGVAESVLAAPVAYCVDWTEQRHHLRGKLGRAFLHRMEELDWLRRLPAQRAVHLTEDGRRGLHQLLGLEVDVTVSQAANAAAR